jgi:1,4-dihydroxy-2-naphthoyl-CoA hydrolase
MQLLDRKHLFEARPPLFQISVDVRFQDIDAAGIVFFARIFDYAHFAYERFLANCGFPLPAVLREKQFAAPLRHAEADYRAPLRYGDEVNIELSAAMVADSEITLGFRVVRGDGKVCAVVQTVHTFVSPDDYQRRSVPPGIVAALAPITRL